MRPDTNTQGHRQWFYFSIRNRKQCRIRLHIHRFRKMYSLFQRGMRPYVKNKRSEEWLPGGEAIAYHYERKGEKDNQKGVRNMVLSFYYTFDEEDDEVYFAAGVPYTYSFLQKQLQIYKRKIDKRSQLKFNIGGLCRSMCGVEVQLITVEHRMARVINEDKKKQYIVINCRTHSGETSCSWVLDGLLMELSISEKIEEWMLNENIVLQIVPMLNPDGVLLGNYRTGIMGEDFNRCFTSGKREVYPEIFGLKRLVSKCKNDGNIALFLDLHGHSILKNSFIYAPTPQDSSHFRLRMLPNRLEHQSIYFNLKSCEFKTPSDKIETARGHFQLHENILSHTCENSLGLYQHEGKTFQMLTADWQKFGGSLLQSIRITWLSETAENAIKHGCERVVRANNIYKSKKKARESPLNQSPVKITIEREDLSEEAESLTHSEQKIMDSNSSFFNKSKQLYHTYKGTKQTRLSNERAAFKIRRKSDIMKTPIASLHKEHEEEIIPFETLNDEKWERSITHNVSFALESHIRSMEESIFEVTQIKDEGNEYEMVTINEECFSEEYSSMNDSDSSEDDLPEAEKNLLLDYIRVNKLEEPAEEEPEKKKELKEKEQKKGYSQFKEVRLSDIEEWGKLESSSKPLRKPEPHKLREKGFRSLATKMREMSEDSEMVSISQQKMLVERAIRPQGMNRAREDSERGVARLHKINL